MTTDTCDWTSWPRKLTLFGWWRNILLCHRSSKISTTTWGGLPTTFEVRGPLPYGSLMFRGHVSGVGLPLVPHRHYAQASVVTGERMQFVSTTNAMAQLPKMENPTADSTVRCRRNYSIYFGHCSIECAQFSKSIQHNPCK